MKSDEPRASHERPSGRLLRHGQAVVHIAGLLTRLARCVSLPRGSHLRPWLTQGREMPVGPLFCVIYGPTQGATLVGRRGP
jgi:hypothetical protein